MCKGLIKEDDLDLHESLRDWFKKEDWVRIDTQGNITGPCGTMKKGKKQLVVYLVLKQTA